MIISSQRYLDDETVQSKIASQDFDVTLSPEFEIGGDTYQVILDGHHSYAAAIEAGIEPTYLIATKQQCDRIAMLDRGQIDDFLASGWMDSDWYDVTTNRSAF